MNKPIRCYECKRLKPKECYGTMTTSIDGKEYPVCSTCRDRIIAKMERSTYAKSKSEEQEEDSL